MEYASWLFALTAIQTSVEMRLRQVNSDPSNVFGLFITVKTCRQNLHITYKYHLYTMLH